MTRDVAVLGVGVHPFGRFDKTLIELAIAAVQDALRDAGLSWIDVNGLFAACSQFVGGFGWRLGGNEFIQAMGESGIAVANLSAACAAGGAAFHSAVNAVASGSLDVAVVVGAEKMPEGFIARPPSPEGDITDVEYLRWLASGAPNTVYWALEARRRMYEVGTTEADLADIAVKAHRVGQHNPRARYRREFTRDEVLASRFVSDPLRLYEVCAVSDGAAAAVVCSATKARQMTTDPIWVRSCVVGTGMFGDPSARIPELSVNALAGVPAVSECTATARRAFDAAGIAPTDVDLLEVQDNSVWQELALPELFGFCEAGSSEKLLASGETLPTGRTPVNPSGGFLSFGEATTAMGVWQIAETAWQLRGAAGARQVASARAGLCQVLGLEGNGVITILGK